MLMPFKSKAQRAYLYAVHPDIAKRWEDKYGSGGKTLPAHVKKTKKKVTAKKRGKRR